MKSSILKNDKNTDMKYNMIFAFEIILFFFLSVFFFVPFSDDLFFAYHEDFQYTNIKELLHAVLYYGNGRLVGNLFALVFTRIPQVFYAIETVLVCILCIAVEKLLEIKHIKLLAMAGIILQPFLLFRFTITWISGFINYYIPVIALCIVLLILKKNSKSETSLPFYYLIAIIFIGFTGQLYVEHHTLINVIISFAVIFVSLIKRVEKSKLLLPIALFISNIAGALVMFTYKFYVDFSQTHCAKVELEEYRTTVFSAGSLSGLVQFAKFGVKHFVYIAALSYLLFSILLYIILKATKQSEKKPVASIVVFVVSYMVLFCTMLGLSLILGNRISLDLPMENKHIFLYVGIYCGIFAIFLLSILVLFVKLIAKHLTREQIMFIIFVAALAVIASVPFFFIKANNYRVFAFSYMLLFLCAISIFKFAGDKLDLHIDTIIKATIIPCIIMCVVYACTLYDLRVEYSKIDWSPEVVASLCLSNLFV